MNVDVSKRTIGVYSDEEGTRVRVWSPKSERVELHLTEEDQYLELEPEAAGYWSATVPGMKPGSRYLFRLDGDKAWPDPVSLAQPGGVHEASAVVDPGSYAWSDEDWSNHPLEEYLIYELHTGTFSPEGDFDGIIGKLDHLVALGVTAIELMPVAQFPGSRNWGYDGVFPFAVQHSYGGAAGLQRLVDACHRRGLAVILDVVYNHLGPEGNYLGLFGPYFTEKYKTPWGGALNFDDAWCDGVRRYFIENALMWLRDFHIDALRLDAVHAIKDFSPVHILREIREAVDEWMRRSGKTHYLIVESDLNDPRFINPVERDGFGMDGQWIDEFHHALRVAAGGATTGYYSDFNGLLHLGKSYSDAYVFDGQFSEHRKRVFGRPANGNEGKQFVVFSQNHDQVGNRMLGERTSTLHSFEMQKLLAGAVFVSPYLPMLFMGEEWGEPHPFLYFVSHTDPELADAVRKGRREEFAAFHAEGEAPDPVAVETFERSKLQWALTTEGRHRTLLAYYQAIIRLRKAHPALKHPDRTGVRVRTDEERSVLELQRSDLVCLMNFSPEEQQITVSASGVRPLFHSAESQWGGPVADTASVVLGSQVRLSPQSILILQQDV